jgi:hypothetical protein
MKQQSKYLFLAIVSILSVCLLYQNFTPAQERGLAVEAQDQTATGQD